MKMNGKTKMDANSANDEFMQIRQRYKELRLGQRKIIIERLEKAGFTVLGKNGGREIRDYTSGRRFQIPRPFELALDQCRKIRAYGFDFPPEFRSGSEFEKLSRVDGSDRDFHL